MRWPEAPSVFLLIYTKVAMNLAVSTRSCGCDKLRHKVQHFDVTPADISCVLHMRTQN